MSDANGRGVGGRRVGCRCRYLRANNDAGNQNNDDQPGQPTRRNMTQRTHPRRLRVQWLPQLPSNLPQAVTPDNLTASLRDWRGRSPTGGSEPSSLAAN